MEKNDLRKRYQYNVDKHYLDLENLEKDKVNYEAELTSVTEKRRALQDSMDKYSASLDAVPRNKIRNKISKRRMRTIEKEQYKLSTLAIRIKQVKQNIPYEMERTKTSIETLERLIKELDA